MAKTFFDVLFRFLDRDRRIVLRVDGDFQIGEGHAVKVVDLFSAGGHICAYAEPGGW